MIKKSYLLIIAGIMTACLFFLAHQGSAQTIEDVDVVPSAGVYTVKVQTAPHDDTLHDTASIGLVDNLGTVLTCMNAGPDVLIEMTVIASANTIVTPHAFSEVNCAGVESVGSNSANLIFGPPGSPTVVP